MARFAYQRLGRAAAALLHQETSRSYGHTGTMLVFDAGPLATPHGGVDFAAVYAAIASRLQYVPAYRKKLRWIPLEGHPVWVDDLEFNLGYHVRHTSLPRPGSPLQLRNLAARLQAHRLDRSRPLWEYWVVEGLEGGRFALLAKTHNALLAGTAADLLQVLLSPDPEAAYPDPPPFRGQPVPSAAELVWYELVRRPRAPRKALARALRLASDVDQLPRVLRRRADELARVLGYALPGERETPLNGPIGPHRRVDHLAFPLAEARRVRAALGGSVLDVVLATLAGGVARYLREHYVNPATLDFRVAVPVGLRAGAEAGGLGVGEWVLDLPIWERDPVRRLERIGQQTAALQKERPAVDGRTLFPVDDWAHSALPAQGARALVARAPVNLRVANVPGPDGPLYLRGARLTECYGSVPLSDNCGLGVTVYGYDGKLFWSLNADFDRVRDLDRMSEALRRAHRELLRVAEGRHPLAVVPAS